MEQITDIDYGSDDVNIMLIRAVGTRPELWDVSHKKYKIGQAKQMAWKDLSQEVNLTEEFMRIRWRSLRDRYMRERKRELADMSYTSSWSIAEHFHYLNKAPPRSPGPVAPKPKKYMRTSERAQRCIKPKKQPSEDNFEYFIVEPNQRRSVQPKPDEEPEDIKPRIEIDPEDPTAHRIVVSSSAAAPSPIETSCNTSVVKRSIARLEIDPLDEIIDTTLDHSHQKPSLADLKNFTSNELFFLSVARDAEELSKSATLRLKSMILNFLADESSK